VTAESEKSSDCLQVAIEGNTAFIRLRGRGSFKISKSLKEFGMAAVEHDASRIVLDLTNCVGMDSTFMGVLAGLAFRLRKKNRGVLHMVNLSSRTRGLLTTLGLDQLVQPSMIGSTPAEFQQVFEQGTQMEALSGCDETRRETAAMMLEAHENLVELSPENLPRFKDVLTFLREDLKKTESDKPAPE
jgi:anti-anti-sigma factor